MTRPQDGSEFLFAGSRVFPKVDGKLYKKVGNFHQLVDNPLRFWEFSSSNNWEFCIILTIFDFKGSSLKFISRIFIIQNWGFYSFHVVSLTESGFKQVYFNTYGIGDQTSTGI